MQRTDEQRAEAQRRAEDVYERIIRPHVHDDDDNKYVAVAFEHDDYEMDFNDYEAVKRLRARRPGAKLFLMKTGPAPACLIGITRATQ